MARVREYQTIEEAIQAVKILKARSVAKEEIYVLAHDKNVTNEAADRSNTEKAGADETGLETAEENIFRGKGDAIRAEIEKIGLSSAEAVAYEQRLDWDKILVKSKDEKTVI